MNKQVTMEIECHTLKGYEKSDIYVISFGGYDFVIDDKNLCFDFDANSAKIVEGHNSLTFLFETGRGMMFNEYDVSEDYEEEYAKFGITREEITAELLSSVTYIEEIASEIVDINDDIIPVCIDRITFTNENDETFEVSRSVIEAYNKINQ